MLYVIDKQHGQFIAVQFNVVEQNTLSDDVRQLNKVAACNAT